MNKIKLIGVILGVCFMQPQVFSMNPNEIVKLFTGKTKNLEALATAVDQGRVPLSTVNQIASSQGKLAEWNAFLAGRAAPPPPPRDVPGRVPPPPGGVVPPVPPAPPVIDLAQIKNLAQQAANLIGQINAKLGASTTISLADKREIAQTIGNAGTTLARAF